VPNVIWPVGGRNDQFGYQSQPPFTTPDAVNVRSLGPVTGRARGGSRPGLVAALPGYLGSDPVTGTIQSVTYLEDTQMTRLVATTPVFAAWMVGMSITCTVPNPDTVYPIVECEDGFTLLVDGDASGESGAFTIPYGQPINMLASVRPTTGTAATTALDTFESRTEGEYLQTSPWAGAKVGDYPVNSLLAVREVDGRRYAVGAELSSGNYYGSCVIEALDIDTGSAYSLSVVLSPHGGSHGVGSADVYLRMDNAAPTRLNCAIVRASYAASGVWSIVIDQYRLGVRTDTTSKSLALGYVSNKTLRIEVNSDVVQVYFDGIDCGSLTDAAPAGARFGLGLASDLLTSPVVLIDEFRIDYSQTTADIDFSDSLLCADAGGTLYVKDGSGAMTAVSGDVDLDADNFIDAVELVGKLWIADHAAAKYHETGCTIDDGSAPGSGRVLDKADVDWSDADPDNDLAYIVTSGGGTPPVGCYPIASVNDVTGTTDGAPVYDAGTTSSTVVATASVFESWMVGHTLDCTVSLQGYLITGFTNGTTITVAGDASGEANVAFTVDGGRATLADSMSAVEETGVEVRILRAPKVYNAATGALSIWNQTINSGVPVGVMPLGCPLIAGFQGRIFLAGSDDNPHVWQCCRTLNPHDWNYSAVDSARAVIGNTDQYGQVAQPLTALIAYLDDHLIFACRRELWVLRGNPADGSPITNLSQGVGVIGKRAWCHTPTGHLVFLGEDGLYAIAPNASSRPEPLSRKTLPRELSGINTDLYEPMLAWDPTEHGVRIFIVPRTQGKTVLSTASHWFLDWDRQAFWPDQLWGAHEPTSLLQYRVPSLGKTVLLVGQRDGQIGYFDRDAGSDYGAPLNASALLGPLRLGDDSYNALIKELTGVLGQTSDGVTWTLYTGNTSEQAYANYEAGTSACTGTWSAGRNTIERPRAKGVAAYIGLSSAGTLPWEFDSIIAKYAPAGRYR
jgi:hypothetical protein